MKKKIPKNIKIYADNDTLLLVALALEYLEDETLHVGPHSRSKCACGHSLLRHIRLSRVNSYESGKCGNCDMKCKKFERDNLNWIEQNKPRRRKKKRASKK